MPAPDANRLREYNGDAGHLSDFTTCADT